MVHQRQGHSEWRGSMSTGAVQQRDGADSLHKLLQGREGWWEGTVGDKESRWRRTVSTHVYKGCCGLGLQPGSWPDSQTYPMILHAASSKPCHLEPAQFTQLEARDMGWEFVTPPRTPHKEQAFCLDFKAGILFNTKRYCFCSLSLVASWLESDHGLHTLGETRALQIEYNYWNKLERWLKKR